jgi:hypothetical protein
MNRLSLSAMSFAGFGLLLIAGTGIASAGRTQDADSVCARIAADLPGHDPSGSNQAKRRSDA